MCLCVSVSVCQCISVSVYQCICVREDITPVVSTDSVRELGNVILEYAHMVVRLEELAKTGPVCYCIVSAHSFALCVTVLYPHIVLPVWSGVRICIYNVCGCMPRILACFETNPTLPYTLPTGSV
jgi:hypothetical protein